MALVTEWETTPPLPETVAMIARMLGWKGGKKAKQNDVSELAGMFPEGKVHRFEGMKKVG